MCTCSIDPLLSVVILYGLILSIAIVGKIVGTLSIIINCVKDACPQNCHMSRYLFRYFVQIFCSDIKCTNSVIILFGLILSIGIVGKIVGTLFNCVILGLLVIQIAFAVAQNLSKIVNLLYLNLHLCLNVFQCYLHSYCDVNERMVL